MADTTGSSNMARNLGILGGIIALFAFFIWTFFGRS
jgi:flagellar biogenesis protein FliO